MREGGMQFLKHDMAGSKGHETMLALFKVDRNSIYKCEFVLQKWWLHNDPIVGFDTAA